MFMKMQFTRIDKNKSSKKEIVAENKKIEKIKKHTWKTSLILLLLTVPIYFYLSFGIKHIAQFETADEYRWIYSAESRIPQYWTAMLASEWKNTRINDKPGITTAIVSGLGLWYVDIKNLPARFVQQGENSRIFNPDGTRVINFSFRFPLLVFNGLLAVLWYFILRRLTDSNWLALWTCSLILLSPVLIGISQIVNPDALLWSTAFTSIIAYLAYLKERKLYDIIIAGLFLGLSLLEKYTAVIIIPFAFFIIPAYLVYKYEDFTREKDIFQLRTLQFFLGFILFTVLGILVYSLLMPAVFLKPNLLIKGNEAFKETVPYLKIIWGITCLILADAALLKSWVWEKILFPFKFLKDAVPRAIFSGIVIIFLLALFNWSQGNFWNIPAVPYNAGNGSTFTAQPLIYQIFLEIRPLVFSLAPAVLLLMAVSVTVYIFKKKPTNLFTVFALAVFMAVFYAAVIEKEYLVHMRYSIMLYPLSAGIAAITIGELMPEVRFQLILNAVIFVAIIFVSVNTINKIYPFYFNYANDFLPKNQTITGAWGYGGYEAAQFINSQSEHPEKLIVWTDYDGFCPFFPGTCVKDSEIKWVGFNTTNKISYYVVTPRGSGLLKDTWAKMTQNISNQPDWELNIDNRPDNYIRVYKVIKSDFKNDNWWRK
jgi:4-amino-4-deoxy-L-arabinose transferase-like glycosyltransferase